jgi:hypothetical protein
MSKILIFQDLQSALQLPKKKIKEKKKKKRKQKEIETRNSGKATIPKKKNSKLNKIMIINHQERKKRHTR